MKDLALDRPGEDGMDAVERSVTQALAARTPPAAAGLEGRILARLEQRRTATVLRRSRLAFPLRWVSVGLATAAVTAGVWLTQRHPRANPARSSVTMARSAAASPSPQIAEAAPQESRLQIAPRRQRGTAAAPRPAALHETGASPRAAGKDFTAEELAMLDDLHAPSQPAPPVPLSRAEKAMVAVVRRGDPVQLAELNAEHRAEIAAVEQAELDRYFNPPPPPKLPDDDHTSALDVTHDVSAKESHHAVSPRTPSSVVPAFARRGGRALRAGGAGRTDVRYAEGTRRDEGVRAAS